MMRAGYFSRRTILVFILGVLGCLALWHFLIRPAEAKLEETSATHAQRTNQVEALRRELARVQAGDSNDAELLFNEVRQMDEVLRPGAGDSDRAFFLQYMPAFATTMGFPDAGDAAPTEPKEEGDSLKFIQYSYKISGSLPQILGFMNAIHDLPYLTTITDFSFSQSSDRGVWSVNLTVRVWWATLPPLPGSSNAPNQPQDPETQPGDPTDPNQPQDPETPQEPTTTTTMPGSLPTLPTLPTNTTNPDANGDEEAPSAGDENPESNG